MKLVVSGGTGFIGTPLCHRLAQGGHEVLVLTRQPAGRAGIPGMRWASWDEAAWQAAIGEAGGVINLAGAPIAAKRWTAHRKQEILDSRVLATRRLVDAIAGHARRPAVLVNASAIGYYGDRGDVPVNESDPPGQGFLAQACQAWEAEALRAQALGVRVVLLRLGIVLGPGGGALAKMVPPFLAGAGGPLGSGRQWMSWVHCDDVMSLVEWALRRPDVQGVVNATAPNPVTMKTFCSALGRALRRPSWAPVPAPVLRLLLGEMAEMLLTGQRVLPDVAMRMGYVFQFSDLPGALDACLARRPR